MSSYLRLLAAFVLLLSCKSHDLSGIYTQGENTVKIYNDSLIYIDIRDLVWSDTYPRNRLLLSGELQSVNHKNYTIVPRAWIFDSLQFTGLYPIKSADSIHLLLKDPTALTGVFLVGTATFQLVGISGKSDFSFGVNDDYKILTKGAGTGYPVKIEPEILRDTNGWWEGALFRIKVEPKEWVLLSNYYYYFLIKAEELEGNRLEIRDNRLPMHSKVYGKILVTIKPKKNSLVVVFKGGRIKLNRLD